jgi:hypothetical protein
MSGGSMNYLYRRLLWESDFQDSTELRKEFRLHLIQVAAALKAIEWVDSGDMSPGDEDEAIAVVLGSTSRGQRMRDSGYTRRPTLREMTEQEPVAWMCDNENLVAKGYIRFSKDKDGAWNVPVYTNPSRHEAELLEALKDAADAIEHWGAYVPEYFQSKHDLEADIDRARDVIAKVEGQS